MFSDINGAESSLLIGGIAALLLFVLYFLPAIIAWARSHHNFGAIFATNLLLGWTFIGWVAALVWSFTNPPPRYERDHY